MSDEKVLEPVLPGHQGERRTVSPEAAEKIKKELKIENHPDAQANGEQNLMHRRPQGSNDIGEKLGSTDKK